MMLETYTIDSAEDDQQAVRKARRLRTLFKSNECP